MFYYTARNLKLRKGLKLKKKKKNVKLDHFDVLQNNLKTERFQTLLHYSYYSELFFL